MGNIKECVNCLGIETTLNCVKATKDYAELGLKAGDSILDYIFSNAMKPSTTTTPATLPEETPFSPVGTLGSSDCAMRLDSRMLNYKITNLNSLATLEYSLSDLNLGLEYSILSSYVEFNGQGGFTSSSSAQVGKVTYGINNLPITISTDFRINTPCGQVKLNISEVLPQSGSGSIPLISTDLGSVSSNSSDINSYVNSLYLKINSLENKVRTMLDRVPSDNSVQVDNLLKKVTAQEGIIEQFLKNSVIYEQQIATLSLELKAATNSVTDLKTTVNALNNLNST